MQTIPNTPREALTMVAELLSDPARWTHEADAVDAAGRGVHPTDPKAVAWSVDGALTRIVAVEGLEEGPEWERRSDVEHGAYQALGIAPGAGLYLRRHEITMSLLGDALAA